MVRDRETTSQVRVERKGPEATRYSMIRDRETDDDADQRREKGGT